MANVRELIKEVLKEGFILNLATHDEGGVWVAPVTYVFDDDFNLYWISFPEVRHSKALVIKPEVAGNIVANHKPGVERALQIYGIAEALTGNQPELEEKLHAKNGSQFLSQERRWYKLTPKKIGLTHNEYFGYDRQEVEF